EHTAQRKIEKVGERAGHEPDRERGRDDLPECRSCPAPNRHSLRVDGPHRVHRGEVHDDGFGRKRLSARAVADPPQRESRAGGPGSPMAREISRADVGRITPSGLPRNTWPKSSATAARAAADRSIVT